MYIFFPSITKQYKLPCRFPRHRILKSIAYDAPKEVHLYPVRVAVCAKAFLRSSAMLVPLQASSTSCMPQLTCGWEIGGELEFADKGEAQLTDGTPKQVLCNEAPLFGIEMLLAIVEHASWRPVKGTWEPKGWPRGVWRGKEDVRARGFPFIGDVILGIEDQRESVGRNVQKASFIVPNGVIPGLGNKAPGVRNTFVVFFLFFHFARRFWNQTCAIRKKKHYLIVIYKVNTDIYFWKEKE